MLPRGLSQERPLWERHSSQMILEFLFVLRFWPSTGTHHIGTHPLGNGSPNILVDHALHHE